MIALLACVPVALIVLMVIKVAEFQSAQDACDDYNFRAFVASIKHQHEREIREARRCHQRELVVWLKKHAKGGK